MFRVLIFSYFCSALALFFHLYFENFCFWLNYFHFLRCLLFSPEFAHFTIYLFFTLNEGYRSTCISLCLILLNLICFPLFFQGPLCHSFISLWFGRLRLLFLSDIPLVILFYCNTLLLLFFCF